MLGEIIATIQKEQNLIIRRSPKTNIIVQGVAGSGKTTVAMHRISYILYNYADDFRPEEWKKLGIKTRYYTTNLHRGAFMLPGYVEQMLEEEENEKKA